MVTANGSALETAAQLSTVALDCRTMQACFPRVCPRRFNDTIADERGVFHVKQSQLIDGDGKSWRSLSAGLCRDASAEVLRMLEVDSHLGVLAWAA